MAWLLFPGRHHLLTNFQWEYLTRVTSGDASTLRDIDQQPLGLSEPLQAILWAVTSANHCNTRRNPFPAYRRVAAIEEFARQLDVPSYVFLIDDIGTTPRFADYVIKKIEVESRGAFCMTPENTVVGCSTPAVIEMYERLKFRILSCELGPCELGPCELGPCELGDRSQLTLLAQTPWQLMQSLVECGLAGRDWRRDETFVGKVARASRQLFLKYDLGSQVIDLHRTELLTDDGDLTETRDYNTYVRSFDDGAVRKYELVRDAVKPGRIVDVGCCTGAVLRELARDDRFRESDLYGVEVARPLYVECLHRKEQGAFANDHVFFYHKDFSAGPVFAANSVDTFTTFSLTHEIESYAGRGALLRFLKLLHDQLAPGGRWINVDVVGPDQPDREILLWLNRDDGRNQPPGSSDPRWSREELRDHLESLSTYARFLQFAQDFRHEEGYGLRYREESIDGLPLVALRLQDACEFISKKDYTDNWQSEMHETFCFWSFDDWTDALSRAGFGPLLPGSRPYTNSWLVEHRYQGRAEMYVREKDGLVPLEYPPTNLMLVAEKVA